MGMCASTAATVSVLAWAGVTKKPVALCLHPAARSAFTRIPAGKSPDLVNLLAWLAAFAFIRVAPRRDGFLKGAVPQ